VASAAGFEDERLAVEIEPATVRRADVVFGRPLAPGPVAGRVQLPPNRSPAGVRVTLYAGGGDERTQTVAADGLFRFEDVRAGACTLFGELAEAPSLQGDRDVLAPALDVVLALSGGPVKGAPADPAAPPWILRARDAASGEPVVNLRVEYEAATFGFELWTYDGEVTLATNPAGTPFTWSLSTDGYRPARGDRDSFKTVTEEGRELHLCLVLLEPGWGTRARVTDEAGSPVPGVPVLVDGDIAGTSEADGRLFLSHALRPRAIGVGAPWRLAPGGMVDPESGAFANPFPELALVVAPR
jgi:hypothetical protein